MYLRHEDTEMARDVALFIVHGYSQAPGACQLTKNDHLSHPKVSKASTSEHWEYFITRRDAHKTATRIADHDATLQPFKYFDNRIRKDHHRSHSKSATGTEIDAQTARL